MLMGTSRQICLQCIYINVNHDFPDLWHWYHFSLVRGNLQGHIAAGTDNFPVPIDKDLKVSNVTYFVFQQTHLLNPTLIDLVLQFYIATASWLNQLALAGDNFEEMTSFKEVEIPLPTEVWKNYLVHAFCTYSYFVCLFCY